MGFEQRDETGKITYQVTEINSDTVHLTRVTSKALRQNFLNNMAKKEKENYGNIAHFLSEKQTKPD